ncbi:MAG TPA: SRPBCC domain-containing protein [Planctomycetota bacterium]|nr:SRPBCC domain-containing protein [Planctomycetota bacterium]
MPITSISKDTTALTLTVIADYDVSVERLYQAWSDPRQLEKFWGPETWPATFTRHDMSVGGRSHYFMTGPQGERTPNAYWEFLKIDEPSVIEVINGFALDDYSPDPASSPMRMTFNFNPTPSGSRFTGITHYASLEAMEEMLNMGMLEGMKSALGQMDAVLEST